MSKMWTGRTDGETASIADEFNSSVKFDKKLYEYDIKGSIAHANMLAHKNIIEKSDAEKIIDGLIGISEDIASGKLTVSDTAEDIHMFVEEELTNRIGDTGKKLHTARSRNDQVALDLRLYLKAQVKEISEKTAKLISAITEKAEENKAVIMSGYTHMQRAQPITFGHHLLTYSMMLLRDMERLCDCYKRINVSPIGSCALAGTTYDTDRFFEANELGFSDVCYNSIDGVSDRDFCLEFLGVCSILMAHLSRLSEELILWSGYEFNYIELSDAFTTGSSIMPQKKNPDMAELVRGKTGRVYGNLMSLLTVIKGLPLAYNKDLQEDKECVFDTVETVKMCLDVYAPMIESMKVKQENMKKAAKEGFINATDLADYLVKKGMSFRDAYKVSGKIVKECILTSNTLDSFPLDKYKEFSELFENDVYDEIALETCVNKRISFGGTSIKNVEKEIEYVKSKLKLHNIK